MLTRLDTSHDVPVAAVIHLAPYAGKVPANNSSELARRRYRVLEEPSPRECRHWPPQSQPYAPADVLLHLLDDGWGLQPQVFVEA